MFHLVVKTKNATIAFSIKGSPTVDSIISCLNSNFGLDSEVESLSFEIFKE